MTQDTSTAIPDNRKIRVIIVDDHPIVIEGVEKTLNATKDISIVGSAINEKSAIELVAQHRPDVVLLDLILKGAENGLEIARIIRTNYPEIHVIIFTTDTMDRSNIRESLELCLDIGVKGYLLKDKPLHELTSAIYTIYEGGTWIDPTISVDLITQKKSTQEMTEALTEREIEVLLLLKEDLSNRELAEKLGVSESTIARHLSNIYGKIGVHRRSAAIKWVNNSGLH